MNRFALGLTELIVYLLCRYDHELDDDYERMQKAENFILSRYTQFLPPAFAPVDSASTAAADAARPEKQQS